MRILEKKEEVKKSFITCRSKVKNISSWHVHLEKETRGYEFKARKKTRERINISW